MSYEGYNEWLTQSGRYVLTDCNEADPVVEADPIQWWHPVDQTNGFVEEDVEGTSKAKKKLIKVVDVWYKDVYGNAYALQENRYQPDSTAWRAYKTKQPRDQLKDYLNEGEAV